MRYYVIVNANKHLVIYLVLFQLKGRETNHISLHESDRLIPSSLYLFVD